MTEQEQHLEGRIKEWLCSKNIVFCRDQTMNKAYWGYDSLNNTVYLFNCQYNNPGIINAFLMNCYHQYK